MDAAQLSKYKARLQQMRQRLVPAVRHSEEAIVENASPPGELSTVPTHPGDMTLKSVDSEIAQAENSENLLEQVEAALRRIDEGTFGRCEQCDAKISRARLDAIPYSPLCINCARDDERAALEAAS